jgi:hypothetical protein
MKLNQVALRMISTSNQCALTCASPYEFQQNCVRLCGWLRLGYIWASRPLRIHLLIHAEVCGVRLASVMLVLRIRPLRIHLLIQAEVYGVRVASVRLVLRIRPLRIHLLIQAEVCGVRVASVRLVLRIRPLRIRQLMRVEVCPIRLG